MSEINEVTICEAIKAKERAENEIRDILQGLNSLFNVKISYINLSVINKLGSNIEHYNIKLDINI